MVSILINIIQHEQYFFSFRQTSPLSACSSKSLATSCLSLKSHHRVNNKCNRVKRSKLGQKLTTTFPTLWTPGRRELQFSVIFFTDIYKAHQETNKTVPAIFLLLNIFWIISSWSFSSKLCFQNSSNYCYKNELLTIR